jgi:hypothetical protein
MSEAGKEAVRDIEVDRMYEVNRSAAQAALNCSR